MRKSHSASGTFECPEIIGIQQRPPIGAMEVDALTIRASMAERRAHPV